MYYKPSDPCNTNVRAMSAPSSAPLTLTDPGQPKTDGGHVRQRATGTKRSVTSVELTMAERRLLDEFAREDGSSRAAVMRDALRAFAAQRGRTPEEFQETPHAA